MTRQTRSHARSKGAHERASHSRMLRIIGGSWRGRRLRFPSQPQIRPTPDRVRETLFNWLGARVAGSSCLDLFAGSGALGLEALSRAAGHVSFVESDGIAAGELRARLVEWQASGAEVHQSDALRFLGGTARAFDIVFLDPPYESDVLVPAAALLESSGWLRPGAAIYVETAARAGLPALPANWLIAKTRQAGAVGYHLLLRASVRAAGE